MNIAFCGIKHAHIFSLYEQAKADPSLRVTGVWDDDEKYISEARSIISEAAYESYEALLADSRVDIVAVGDAFGARGREIIHALNAGKHVISDKPLCTRASELDEIEALSKAKCLRVGCMLDLRYDPALRTAGEIMRAGELGEIHCVNFTGQHPLNYGSRPIWYYNKSLHGGTFNDLAIHGIDAVRVMTGLKYRRTLCARQYNAFAVCEKEFADCAQFMAEYENGAGLTGDVSYSAPADRAYELPSYWRFDFWGENGMMECALGAGKVLIAKNGEQMKYVSAKPVCENYLSDLLMRIRGEETTFDDGILFETTRATLDIQMAANGRKDV